MPFLTAEWRDLVIFNWEVPPEALAPFVPRGTCLDDWQGRTFLSLVGFRFLNTRLRGIAIPFHVNFEEVNLRYYVKRCGSAAARHGVVFLKEIVPRACVSLVARRVYNENYITAPMSHVIERGQGSLTVRYDWTVNRQKSSISASSDGEFAPAHADSHESFIIENYWGYTRQRDGGTVEYEVGHPSWRVAKVHAFKCDCDFAGIYGEPFGNLLSGPPFSVLLADGSHVTVGFGNRI